MASAYFQLYKYIKSDIGEEKTKEQFKSFMNGTERVHEYFRKLIELDNEPKTESEKKIETMSKYKNK